MNRTRIFLLVAIASAAMTTNAYAYMDPVTGTFIVQGIAAGFAGAMVAFRSLRERMLALVLGRTKRRDGAAGSSVKHDS
jgi:UDP-N-acetylmuramyl pentapeptide phosphotransferase/UDP-N-acetylglucosamine-1-phosphate transferase